MAKLVAASERACCIAGTVDGPVAGPLPLSFALALYLEVAVGGDGTFADGGGTCEDGTKKASGWD